MVRPHGSHYATIRLRVKFDRTSKNSGLIGIGLDIVVEHFRLVPNHDFAVRHIASQGEIMRAFTSFVAVMGIAASIAAAADVPPVPVTGRILQLNKPGAIAIEISVGRGDGLKIGDVFVVSRKDKRIGKVIVAKVDADQSTATIQEVANGEVIERGDQVIRQR